MSSRITYEGTVYGIFDGEYTEPIPAENVWIGFKIGDEIINPFNRDDKRELVNIAPRVNEWFDENRKEFYTRANKNGRFKLAVPTLPKEYRSPLAGKVSYIIFAKDGNIQGKITDYGGKNGNGKAKSLGYKSTKHIIIPLEVQEPPESSESKEKNSEDSREASEKKKSANLSSSQNKSQQIWTKEIVYRGEVRRIQNEDYGGVIPNANVWLGIKVQDRIFDLTEKKDRKKLKKVLPKLHHWTKKHSGELHSKSDDQGQFELKLPAIPSPILKNLATRKNRFSALDFHDVSYVAFAQKRGYKGNTTEYGGNNGEGSPGPIEMKPADDIIIPIKVPEKTKKTTTYNPWMSPIDGIHYPSQPENTGDDTTDQEDGIFLYTWWLFKSVDDVKKLNDLEDYPRNSSKGNRVVFREAKTKDVDIILENQKPRGEVTGIYTGLHGTTPYETPFDDNIELVDPSIVEDYPILALGVARGFDRYLQMARNDPAQFQQNADKMNFLWRWAFVNLRGTDAGSKKAVVKGRVVKKEEMNEKLAEKYGSTGDELSEQDAKDIYESKDIGVENSILSVYNTKKKKNVGEYREIDEDDDGYFEIEVPAGEPIVIVAQSDNRERGDSTKGYPGNPFILEEGEVVENIIITQGMKGSSKRKFDEVREKLSDEDFEEKVEELRTKEYIPDSNTLQWGYSKDLHEIGEMIMTAKSIFNKKVDALTAKQQERLYKAIKSWENILARVEKDENLKIQGAEVNKDAKRIAEYVSNPNADVTFFHEK